MPVPTDSDDDLSGTPGIDFIDGLGGNDTIRGRGGNDQLYGGTGNDILDGGDGDDQLHGDEDNDYLRGGPGDDLIDGGTGFDRVAYFTATSGVTVDLRIQDLSAQNTGGAGNDTIINIDHVSGSIYTDTLYGNDNPNWIWALGPTNGITPTNDNLYGNGGDDLLQAGTGDHILDGGSGNDTVSFGQPGEILFAVPNPNFGDGIVVNLSIIGAQNTRQGMMTLTSIENVSGSVLDDLLTGNNNANVIAGDAGNDVLNGLGGNDTIYGDGAIGIDSGGTGTSGPITTFTADQGIGFDFYDAAGQLVFLYAGQPLYDAAGNLLPAPYVSSDPEDPYTDYYVNGVHYIFYVGGPTPTDGVVGNDVLDGGTGDDTLYGGGGHDLLRGGAGLSSGNDTLDGGDGDDYITGGAGNDMIIGGAGVDRAGYFTSTGGVGVTVDLGIVGIAQNTGSQGMDTLSGIENLSGTTFNDTLTGDGGDNWLWGSTANFNNVFSATNDDTIFGMGGNDLIVVGIGNHLLDGGAGNDTLRFTENGQIVENGINVSLALQGSAQTTGYGDWNLGNFENLSGGQGNDHLIGDGGANRLTGEGGDDTLEGGGGNDTLSGDAVYDADTHGLGYSGAARLQFDPDAAPGNDDLDGGAGDDTALFLLAPGAGTLTVGHDGGDLLILRGSEVVARVSFVGEIVTVQGLHSAAGLGSDTLINIEHLSFQIDGGGAPLVVDLSGGVVVDGYVAGGTVFADTIQNGVLDAGEASATTDAQGNFVLPGGSGPLVMFGGTNIDTGLPNLVTLTAPEGSTVVNPLTTLVQILVEGGSSLASAQDAVANAFGIDTGIDLTSFDPLAAAPGDPDALAVQQASAAVVVLVLAGSDAAGGGDANENAVFDALADAIAGAGGGAVDLTDTSTVTDILTDALPVGSDISGATQDVTDAADAIYIAADLAGVAAAQQDALNDPPEVIVPATFAATEQVALNLKTLMSVSDADSNSGTVNATLSVGYGVLHVAVGTSGASVISGNDSSSVTVTGTIGEINDLLGGDPTSVVTYTADTNTPPATTTLTLSVDDGGNSGAGGPLTGSDSGTINITAVNDAPILSNYDNVIAASGTGPIDLRIAAPADPEGDPVVTITLDNVPGYGVVEYFDGTSWIAATGGETLTAAELVSLRYTPPASGEFGGETIAYSASDGTATAHGTIAVTSQVVTTDPLQLLFAAIDTTGNNPDLYRVDGAGALIAAPLNMPIGSFAGEYGGFFQFNGATYFNAFTPATGDVLFSMAADGTVAPLGDGSGGYFVNLGGDAHFTRFGGSLYFDGSVGGSGDFAIRLGSDGSFSTVDTSPGFLSFAGANGGFVLFDNSLFYSAVTTNGAQPDLIRLEQDGSFAVISTRSAGNAANGSFAGEDGGFIVFNNALYFNAFGDIGGDTLFRLDAGSATPVAVGAGLFSHQFSGIDSAFHIFAGSLYFNEFSSVSGDNGLFKLDPSGAISEIDYLGAPLVGAGALGGFVDFGGATWFTASTPGTGLDLFRLDDCGCLEAIDVNFGTADAFDINLVPSFAIFGGALYFDAYDAPGEDHLYRITADGFLDLVDLGGGGTTLAGIEGGFQQAFGSLFFSAFTADGYEIVRLEQDGSYTDYDINSAGDDNAVVPGDGQTFGLLNGNALTGTDGNDIVAGSTATEILSGGGGDDVLESRGGNDHLAGGDGTDLFVLSQSGAANLVTLDDYDFLSGDKVDLSALLDAGFGPNSSVSDFARLFAVEGDLKLQIDADGTANGTHWTDVAILTGGNSFVLDSVEVHFNGADYTLTESFNFNLQTVTLAAGGWVVTWSQPTLEDGDLFANVFGRVFDSDGHQVGGTFQISADDNAMDDENNLVAALPNGDFAVVWQACENEIWTRVYHADGTPVTDPVVVQAPDPDVFEILPGGIVALSNGGYALLWAQLEAPADGGENVYISTFEADGTPVSGPVLVNSVGAGSPDHDDGLTANFELLAIAETTQIVKLASGFAVIWISGRDTGPAGAMEDSVFVRVFDNDGNPVSGEIQANTDGGANSVDGGVHDYHPELVALGGMDFAVVWESDASSVERMFARIFHAPNYAAGAPVRLDANADPDVLAETWDSTALVNGGFVALWDQLGVNGSDIYIQVFDAAGAIASGSVAGGLVVNQVSNVASLSDQVLALSGGGFAVLYDSIRDDGVGVGDDQDVYIRTYAADGTPTSNEVRVNPADDVDNGGLALAALPNGGFVVLWAQDAETANGGRTDIFARIFSADGTPFGGPITVGSSPSDLSYAQEVSLLQELRDAVSANGDLLVAWISDDTVDFANFASSLSIALLDSPPSVDLNGAAAGIDRTTTYTENGAPIPIGGTIAVADVNAGDQIVQAIVTLTNAQPGDLLTAGALPAGISAAVTTPAGMIVITLSGAATTGDYAAAISAITYANSSDDPATVDRTITVVVNDGAADSNAATATIQVIAQDDAPVVRADAVTTDEATLLNGNVLLSNGSGADSDVDGPPPSVSAVNGSALSVGMQIGLASGALLKLNADGTFTYDPNHAFDATPTAGSGAANAPAHDSFTYTLTGGSSTTVSVSINGLDSDDRIFGTGGVDHIFAGIGNDEVYGMAGADVLGGGDGNDFINGDGDSDQLYGDAGNDFLVGEVGDDQLYGQAGDDRLEGREGSDLLDGGIGDDRLFGGDGDDHLVGGDGNDQLAGDANDDLLEGGSGNDLLDGGDGDDRVFGGTGADYLFGGLGNDRLYGEDNADTIGGGDGDDLIEGGDGADLLYGDAGNDLVRGGLGSDQLYGQAGADRLEGGSGDDLLDGGTGNDLLFGGDGFDHLVGGAGADQLSGEAADDLLDGGDGDDVIDGGLGADHILGGTGADYLVGGDGNDQLYGNENEDTIGGGDGNDLIDGGTGADHLYGDAGADYIVGGDGDDFIFGQDDDDIIGGQNGNDVIDGGAGADKLYGDDGNDTIAGGAGNDQLYGQLGNDSLDGGDGNDLIDGGFGNDLLTGGIGADSFLFTTTPLGIANTDQIADFEAGIDKLVLDHAVFDQLVAGSLPSSAFVAGTAANDADDRIIYDQTTGNLYYDADGNGAGAAVLFANLSSHPVVTASDFQVI